MLLALTIPAPAKKANAKWFFLEKLSNSVCEDENIHIQYGIYTKYTAEFVVPYPVLRIQISNKSEKIIFVDLGTSYLKRNNIASTIYSPTITSSMVGQNVGIGVNVGSIAGAIGIGGMAGVALNGINIGGGKGSSITTTTYAQRVVSIPPRSAIFLDDIQIFAPGCENALGNIFHFEMLGRPKRPCCLAYKSKDVESGGVYDYTETQTLFYLGCFLNYSFTENFTESKGVETTYYVKRLVGTHFNTFPGLDREFNIVGKVFPDWADKVSRGELEVIRLWAH